MRMIRDTLRLRHEATGSTVMLSDRSDSYCSPAMHFPQVGDTDDEHKERIVLHLVENAVIADPKSSQVP